MLNRITVWGKAFDKHLKIFVTLQSKTVKLNSGAQWRDHVTPFNFTQQILKLNDLYLYEVDKLMYMHTHKKLLMRLSTFLAPVKVIHTRNIRLALFE